VKQNDTGAPTASPQRREARRWIERQLRWEHTLDALRHRRGRTFPAGKAA
jgi:hypothetical protein